MLWDSTAALCGAGRGVGTRATRGRLFTGRRRTGRAIGLGTTGFFLSAVLRMAGFFALAALSATWRDTYRGAAVSLEPASYAAIDASARAVSVILAHGEPVYGINTGFGKLANVRIDTADLETLQRNIVLSHAAGVGPPMPVAIARLMIALKLASLGQGASGVRSETIRLLAALLAKGLTPVVP